MELWSFALMQIIDFRCGLKAADRRIADFADPRTVNEAFMSGSQITTFFEASVRSLRYRLGLSEEASADLAGLHRSHIAAIEGWGRNVTHKI